jgi:hypothetical protein
MVLFQLVDNADLMPPTYKNSLKLGFFSTSASGVGSVWILIGSYRAVLKSA